MKRLDTETVKLIKHSLGFCLFLCVVLWTTEKTLSFLVRHSGAEQTGKVNLIFEHKIDPEILIMGSSVAEVGLNPIVIQHRTHKEVYNAALDGTPILKSNYLIREFLSYSHHCKHILIGVAFLSFSEMNHVYAPERFLAYKSHPFVQQNVQQLSPELYGKLAQVPFYSFVVANHSYYKNAYLGLLNLANHHPLQCDSLHGFVPHYAPYADTRSQAQPMLIDISESSVAQYSAILNDIRSHGIAPVLIVAPMYKDGQQAFINYSEYVATVRKIGERTHTIVFDFSTHAMTGDKTFFYNNGHLNTKGARLFSAAVSDSLATINE